MTLVGKLIKRSILESVLGNKLILKLIVVEFFSNAKMHHFFDCLFSHLH